MGISNLIRRAKDLRSRSGDSKVLWVLLAIVLFVLIVPFAPEPLRGYLRMALPKREVYLLVDTKSQVGLTILSRDILWIERGYEVHVYNTSTETLNGLVLTYRGPAGFAQDQSIGTLAPQQYAELIPADVGWLVNRQDSFDISCDGHPIASFPAAYWIKD